MNRYFSRLLALVLVVVIGLMGCSSNSVTGLSGDYHQDTFSVVNSLRTAIQLPDDAPDKIEAQSKARQIINDFASRYQRDTSILKLSSFTTMRTALNSLAAHYASYPNRPLPQQLKDRLEQEFKQVEAAINRGS